MKGAVSARRSNIVLRTVVATMIAAIAIGVSLLLDGAENQLVGSSSPTLEVTDPPRPTLLVSESIVHGGDVIRLRVQASQERTMPSS
jgi:hypothetical protein